MIKREELSNPESCMSRAREDEMTFVLLGRDKAAPVAICAWVTERLRLGKNTRHDAQITEALVCAEIMAGNIPPVTEPAAAPALSSYAFNNYGNDAKLYNGIADLERQLSEARSDKEYLRQANLANEWEDRYKIQQDKIADLELRNRELEAQVSGYFEWGDKVQNDEASVCPEDVGFVEYIGVLKKRNLELVALLRSLSVQELLMHGMITDDEAIRIALAARSEEPK